MILNLPDFLNLSKGSPEDCGSVEGFIDSHGWDDFVQHGYEDLGGSFGRSRLMNIGCKDVCQETV